MDICTFTYFLHGVFQIASPKCSVHFYLAFSGSDCDYDGKYPSKGEVAHS